ncbi:sugar phosphate isomerase/epimerase family protein [Cohnella mopanensis]|uniref:sugar phosphate isomerase/epimerase family protein n=1 Tax=Cohnella mopanensis TaxID=2911966 RepID=UPI001EF7EE72|nr:sugar phosphate isomerase/epimerase [Cohnella mopanensis]
MNIGILAHLLGYLPYEQLAAKVAANGFRHVQLALWKAISDFDFSKPGQLSPGLAQSIGEAFDKRGATVSVLGCYLHLFDRDEEQLRLNRERFKELLRHARHFGCTIVAAETGGPWNGTPSEEEWKILRSTLEQLAEEADKWGVRIGLEPANGHLIDTPVVLKRMLDEVTSSSFGVVLDPGNLLTSANMGAQNEVIEEAFRLLGDRIVACHAKDRILMSNGQIVTVAPGAGQMNYELYLQRLEQVNPGAPLIMEAVNESDILSSRSYLEELQGQLAKDSLMR